MHKLISKDHLDLFTKGMDELQNRGIFIPEGQEKNRQFLKDRFLREMKSMFEAVDKNNPEAVTTAALNIANNALAIAFGCGKMTTYINKILNLGTLSD